MENKWQEVTEGQNVLIVSQHVIIGKQGVTLIIPECKFVKKLFNVTDSVPQVSLYVEKKWEGPMMKKGKQGKWERTENLQIFIQLSKITSHILCGTSLMGIP